MNVTVTEFIKVFANNLCNDQVSLFVGSGVSNEIGLPSWKELLSNIAKSLSLNIENVKEDTTIWT